MSMRFDVNKWLLHCLPPVLRQRVVYALFSCCLQPIRQLHDRYAEYADRAGIQLIPRSNAGLLASWLNEIFYLPEGTIYIEDSIDSNTYLFYEDESPQNTYLYTQDEGGLLHMYYQPSDAFNGFYVMVPESIATEANLKTIDKWIKYYKIAGVNFRIVING